MRLGDYWKPTPTNMRKLGDAILAFGLTFSGVSTVTLPDWVTILALVVTGVGKFITNMYAE